MNMPIEAEVEESIQMVTDTAKDFAEKYVRPHLMEWDESQHFPKEIFHKASTIKKLKRY